MLECIMVFLVGILIVLLLVVFAAVLGRIIWFALVDVEERIKFVQRIIISRIKGKESVKWIKHLQTLNDIILKKRMLNKCKDVIIVYYDYDSNSLINERGVTYKMEGDKDEQKTK